MIAAILAVLVLQAGEGSTLQDRDPRALPRAVPERWLGFDPAKVRADELPKGMLDVRDALLARDYPRSLAGLHHVLTEAPDFPPALHQLGVLYFRLQRYGDAAVCLERYLEVAPVRIGDTRVLAHCYYSLGDYPKALAHYERVLAQNPSEVEALRGHALARMRLGDLPGALEELERVLALVPEHAEAWLWKAQILFDLDRLEESLQAATRARDLDRFEPRCWFLLGRVQTDLGRADEAESALRRFRELNLLAQEIRSVEHRLLYKPADPELRQRLVELHRAAGNAPAVREALALLFASFPESLEFRLYGLDVLEGLADHEAAKLVAQKLEVLGAENGAVWRRLESFYARIKDRPKQLEAGERARRLAPK